MVIYGLQTAGKRYLANDVDAKFERQLPHSGEVRIKSPYKKLPADAINRNNACYQPRLFYDV